MRPDARQYYARRRGPLTWTRANYRYWYVYMRTQRMSWLVVTLYLCCVCTTRFIRLFLLYSCRARNPDASTGRRFPKTTYVGLPFRVWSGTSVFSVCACMRKRLPQHAILDVLDMHPDRSACGFLLFPSTAYTARGHRAGDATGDLVLSIPKCRYL